MGPVSQANLDSVRRIYEAFADRDMTKLVSAADPAIMCYDRPNRPGATVYTGHDGLILFAKSDFDAFEDVRYDPREFIHVGDYVVVPIRQSGRGNFSQVPVEEDIVNVWKFRDGKAVELRCYSSTQEALLAVGE